tara:strand:+ start:314 stop:505 length:192 start_codon:yes stop_codon:yes gene_type:complete
MKNIKRKEVISLISKARTKNNSNWMKLLEIAFKFAPKHSKKILKDINKQDKKINKLAEKLSKI